MSLISRIVDITASRCGNSAARDVRLGLGYSAVKLDDGRTGVAYTFRDRLTGGCTVFEGKRPLAGKSASDLLNLLLHGHELERAIGLATVNALCNILPPEGLPGDVLEAIELLPSDHVGMVGFFAPLIPTLRKRVRNLTIFEEKADESGGLLPATEAVERLQQCDIALITSTAIINHTIDGLLEAASHCRQTVLLGSSTPLVPEAFKGTPVTFLSGITVTDSDGILQVVSEGGGTRLFRPFVTKWNFPVRRQL